MGNYNIENLKFMIVDDNKHMRGMVKGVLVALGGRNVLEADNGADAMKELQHFFADIVICDWNMGPVDGIEFTRMVRTNPESPNQYLPILMLTGHTELARVMEARDAGVSEFLAKPISAQSLYSRINSIIERPRPFIRTKTYFGPDRRRHMDKDYKGAERRKLIGEGGGEGEENPGTLSKAEVDTLLEK